MAENINYERDIVIDDSALDVEWLDQPSLFMKYARNAANCRQDVDEAKEGLDLAKAELDKDIREHPKKYKIGEDIKITEAVVSAAIIMDDKYKAAMKRMADAKYDLDIAQAAVSAMNQRKEALENMVKLYIAGYFAGPRVPHNLTEEREKRKVKQEETNKKISTNLKRGTK
jgi:hypothetical protein